MTRALGRGRVATIAVFALVVGLLGAPARSAPAITHGFVASFDQTPIAYTLLIPDGTSSATPAPVVLMTHGWGGRRERAVAGMVKTLIDAGYAVLTWDQRGFGDSGGEAQVDSQQYEVRDVRTLIDFVADPASTGGAVLLDAPGDPRVGMVGPSYAGGIQLMTASADQRIDAIAPQIAWNDLPEALKPGGVLKLAWDLLLYGAGLASAAADGLDSPAGTQTGAYAEEIHRSLVEGTTTNDWSAATFAWFDARSPKHYLGGADVPGIGHLDGVHAPALLLQGTNDTLFPINHAIASYDQIRANGVNAKMIFFCGLLTTTQVAHSLSAATSCAFGNQGATINQAILTWFDRYLRDNLSADTGAAIDYQLQDGTFSPASALPATTVSGTGSGTLVGAVVPTSGSQVLATPSLDGFRVAVPAPGGSTILGVPHATVTVTGTGEETYLFFRLLDVDANGSAKVIDDQVTARKVVSLSSTPQQIALDLNGVAWRLASGHSLFLEVSSSSNDHASPRSPSVANVTVSVSVPVL